MSTEDRPDEKTPDTVEVARLGGLFEAKHLAGLLEAEGIPTFIPNENTLYAYDGAAVAWEGGVRVMVPADRANEARDILAAWEAQKKDVPEDDAD